MIPDIESTSSYKHKRSHAKEEEEEEEEESKRENAQGMDKTNF